jgi:hypothetical protein
MLKPYTYIPTAEEDAEIAAGIAADPDNPEQTAEDFARAKLAREFFAPETFAKLVALRPRGWPRPENKKVFTARFCPLP